MPAYSAKHNTYNYLTYSSQYHKVDYLSLLHLLCSFTSNVRSKGLWASPHPKGWAKIKHLVIRAKISPTPLYPRVLLNVAIPPDFGLHSFTHSKPVVLHLHCTSESPGKLWKFPHARGTWVVLSGIRILVSTQVMI